MRSTIVNGLIWYDSNLALPTKFRVKYNVMILGYYSLEVILSRPTHMEIWNADNISVNDSYGSEVSIDIKSLRSRTR